MRYLIRFVLDSKQKLRKRLSMRKLFVAATIYLLVVLQTLVFGGARVRAGAASGCFCCPLAHDFDSLYQSSVDLKKKKGANYQNDSGRSAPQHHFEDDS